MKKTITALVLIAVLSASLTACSSAGTDTDSQASKNASSPSSASSQAESSTKASDTENSSSEKLITTANTTSNGKLDTADLFTERDLTQTADMSEAKSYTVSDGTNITINAAGVYVISGSASNASVIIDAGDNDKVQLVLNGVSITNTDTPCIYVKNADKVFVTTAEGSGNTLSVTGTFGTDGETKTDAVIFSKDDLVLNGLGTLSIKSSDNGVSCKDDLKITGGTIDIECSADALEANDSVSVAAGTVNIKSQKDGIHSENDDDNSKGYVYICGGTFDINANGDGIQGTTVVQIDGGTFTISGTEGIEGTYVQINDGKIGISATDDGINGSAKSTSYSVTVEINGGEISIDMGQGDTDGIDSNGDLYINGGTVSINGQSPFDYDGKAEKNGGTIIVNGEQTDTITNQLMGGGMGGMRGGMQPGERPMGGEMF